MPTVVATPAASNANSYLTVAEADTIADERLDMATWTAASADDKARAVIAATRTLDPLPWDGYRDNGTQALSWPRAYALNPDRAYDATNTDAFFLDTVVPDRLKRGTALLAFAYVKAGTTDLRALDDGEALVSKTIGPISKTWDLAQRAAGLARVDGVMDQIGPLLRGGQDGTPYGQLPMVRV